MSWFYELAWLWKGLGISLLAAAAWKAKQQTGQENKV